MTDLTQYYRGRITLYPKKFAIGTYMANELRAELAEVAEYFYDETLLRLTTQVLTGNTVSEEQEVSVQVPATWFQHLKERVSEIFQYKGGKHPVRRWLTKHPVRHKKLSAKVKFSRDTLYPGANIEVPPEPFGKPVVWETVSLEPGTAPDGQPWNLDVTQPSRFVSRDEIKSILWRQASRGLGARFDDPYPRPEQVLDWLASHGVNPDQLVPRSAL